VRPQMRDLYGNATMAPEGALSAVLDTPSGEPMTLETPRPRGGGVGAYEVSLEPTQAGLHALHILLHGHEIAGSPLAFEVAPAPFGDTPGDNRSVAKCTLKRHTEAPPAVNAAAAVYLTTIDRYGNRLSKGGCRIEAKGFGSSASACTVEDLKNGTYKIAFTSSAPGEVKLVVRVEGSEVAPMSVLFVPRHKAPKQNATKESADVLDAQLQSRALALDDGAKLAVEHEAASAKVDAAEVTAEVSSPRAAAVDERAAVDWQPPYEVTPPLSAADNPLASGQAEGAAPPLAVVDDPAAFVGRKALRSAVKDFRIMNAECDEAEPQATTHAMAMALMREGSASSVLGASAAEADPPSRAAPLRAAAALSGAMDATIKVEPEAEGGGEDATPLSANRTSSKGKAKAKKKNKGGSKGAAEASPKSGSKPDGETPAGGLSFNQAMTMEKGQAVRKKGKGKM